MRWARKSIILREFIFAKAERRDNVSSVHFRTQCRRYLRLGVSFLIGNSEREVEGILFSFCSHCGACELLWILFFLRGDKGRQRRPRSRAAFQLSPWYDTTTDFICMVVFSKGEYSSHCL